LARSFLVGFILLVAAGILSAAPVAQSLPLGEVVAGGNLVVGNTAMPRGATIFDGDAFRADKESSVLQFAQDGKIELYPGAAASVAKESSQVTVNLRGGKISYALPKGSRVLFDTPKVTIRTGSGSDLFVGTIERNTDSAIVQPVQGEMIVQNKETGETATVRPGYTATCIVGTPIYWAGDPYAVTRFPWIYVIIGAGAVETGIIIHEVIKEEPPASPSGR
jgi:hypothetical protein